MDIDHKLYSETNINIVYMYDVKIMDLLPNTEGLGKSHLFIMKFSITNQSVNFPMFAICMTREKARQLTKLELIIVEYCFSNCC